MFVFDFRRAITGMAIGLVVGGLIGVPLLFLEADTQAPAVLLARAAKWHLYLGIGGTILIWHKGR